MGTTIAVPVVPRPMSMQIVIVVVVVVVILGNELDIE